MTNAADTSTASFLTALTTGQFEILDLTAAPALPASAFEAPALELTTDDLLAGITRTSQDIWARAA